MKRAWCVAISLFLCLCFLGCQKEQKMGSKELVRVNDVSISYEEFRRFQNGNLWKER